MIKNILSIFILTLLIWVLCSIGFTLKTIFWIALGVQLFCILGIIILAILIGIEIEIDKRKRNRG